MFSKIIRGVSTRRLILIGTFAGLNLRFTIDAVPIIFHRLATANLELLELLQTSSNKILPLFFPIERNANACSRVALTRPEETARNPVRNLSLPRVSYRHRFTLRYFFHRGLAFCEHFRDCTPPWNPIASRKLAATTTRGETRHNRECVPLCVRIVVIF